jgi:hypothetical protein
MVVGFANRDCIGVSKRWGRSGEEGRSEKGATARWRELADGAALLAMMGDERGSTNAGGACDFTGVTSMLSF